MSSELTDNDITFTADGIISAASNLTLQNSTGTPFTWPTTDPAVNGYVLSSTTGGTMSWIAQSGGGSSSGALGAIQLSDGSGGFDGDTSLLLFDDFTFANRSVIDITTSGSSISPVLAVGAFIGINNNANTDNESAIVLNCGTAGTATIAFIEVANATPTETISYNNSTGLTIDATSSSKDVILGTSDNSNGLSNFTDSSASGINVNAQGGDIELTSLQTIEFEVGGFTYIWPQVSPVTSNFLRIQSILGSVVTLEWS